MEGTALVADILEIFGAGITGVATSVASALGELATNIFFVTADGTTTISVLGVCIIVFAAISLGLGLMRWVLNFFTSLGSRNR